MKILKYEDLFENFENEVLLNIYKLLSKEEFKKVKFYESKTIDSSLIINLLDKDKKIIKKVQIN